MLPRTKHPQINEMIDKLEEEVGEFRRVHRMIDLYETIIKTHTAVLMAMYFENKKISTRVTEVLVKEFFMPSLGSWQKFSRTIFQELAYNYKDNQTFVTLEALLNKQEQEKLHRIYVKQEEHYILRSQEELKQVKGVANFLRKSWGKYYKNVEEENDSGNHFLLSEFIDYFEKWSLKITDVIQFRNKYAHGATPGEEECKSEFVKFMPLLIKTLQYSWLSKTTVVVLENNNFKIGHKELVEKLDLKIEDNIPYLIYENGKVLKLFPIVIVKDIDSQKTSLTFFNDLKKHKSKKVSYLNYPFAKHFREDDIYERFIDVIQLEEWKKNVSDSFYDTIALLSENFKGRATETKKIETFINNHNRGFLFLTGAPGIGKSALVANLLHEQKEGLTVLKYFINKGIYGGPQYVHDYLSRSLESCYETNIGFGTTLDEKREFMHLRLQEISNNLKNEKLVIFIDGIDEADNYFLQHLIYETYSNIFIVYSGRKTQVVKSFYSRLPIINKKEIELGEISEQDILAMLYESTNKYLLNKAYIHKINEKSKGNPLYVKLLCESLLNNPDKLNDLNNLPEELEEFYEEFIDRVTKTEQSDVVLDALLVFGAANDSLSLDQLEEILQLHRNKVNEIFYKIEEVLVENKQNVGHFYLFHESLRDYLKKKYKVSLHKCEQRILLFCEKWQEYQQLPSVQRYPLHFYQTHLFTLRRFGELKNLSMNNEFLQQQVTITDNYTASFTLFDYALQAASETKDDQGIVQLLIRVLSFHKEMNEKDLTILFDQLDVTKFRKQLSKFDYLNIEDKARGYFICLYFLIEKQLNEKDKLVDIIVEKIMNDFVDDPTIFNWADYIPFHLLLHTATRLFKEGYDFKFIVDRIQIDESAIKEVLNEWKSEEIVEEIYYYIIEVLDRHQNNNNRYDQDIILFHLASALLSKGQIMRGLHAANKLKELSFSRLTINHLEERNFYQLGVLLAKHNLLEEAEAFIELIHYDEKRSNAYYQIFLVLQERQVKQASDYYERSIEIAETIDDLNERLCCLSSLLLILNQQKDYEKENLFLEEIMREHSRLNPIFNSIVLTNVTNYYLQLGEDEKAFEVLGKITEEFLYEGAIFNYYLKRNELKNNRFLEKIRNLFQEKASYLFTVDDEEYKFYEYRIQIKEPLSEYILEKEESEGDQLLAKIPLPLEKDLIFLELLTTWIKKGKISFVIKKINEWECNHHQPEFFYKKIAETMVNCGYHNELLMLLNSMEDEFVKNETIFVAAKTSIQQNKLFLFNALFELTKTAKHQKILIFEKIKLYSQQQRWQESLQLIMLQQNNHGIPLADEVKQLGLTSVALALFKLDKVDKVEQVFADPLIKFKREDVYEELLSYYLKEKKFNKAHSLILKEFQTEEYRKKRQEDYLIELVIAMAKAGDETVVSLLDGFYENKTSFKMSNSILSPYYICADSFFDGGRENIAEKIIQLAEKEISHVYGELKGLLYCVHSSYLFNKGKKEAAKRVMDKALTIELKEFYPDWQLMVVIQFAYELKKQGRQEYKDYQEILKKGYKDLEPGHELKDKVYKQMATVLLEDLNMEKAKYYIDKIKTDYLLESSLLILMESYLENKHFNEALYVFNKINEVGELYKTISIELIIPALFTNELDDELSSCMQKVTVGETRIKLYELILKELKPQQFDRYIALIDNEELSVKTEVQHLILGYLLKNPEFARKKIFSTFAALPLYKNTVSQALYCFVLYCHFVQNLDGEFAEEIKEIVSLLDLPECWACSEGEKVNRKIIVKKTQQLSKLFESGEISFDEYQAGLNKIQLI